MSTDGPHERARSRFMLAALALATGVAMMAGTLVAQEQHAARTEKIAPSAGVP